jgi:hypothetical protein
MTWTVTGHLYETGAQAKLSWDRGTLSGSPDALAAVDALLLDGRAVAVTPTGPWELPDLHNDVSCFVMALHVLRRAEVTGDPPKNLPSTDVPPGAIP